MLVKVTAIPVSWYLDDWPAVECGPGVSPLGTHNDIWYATLSELADAWHD